MTTEYDLSKIEDLALDYVEQELGRIHFQDNWVTFDKDELAAIKDAGTDGPAVAHNLKIGRIAIWLTGIGEDISLAPDIADYLDYEWKTGKRWIIGQNADKQLRKLRRKSRKKVNVAGSGNRVSPSISRMA